MEKKLYEILFSFFLTTLVVGGVALTAACVERQIQQNREARQAEFDRKIDNRRQIESQFLQILSTYNDIKKVRREARLFIKFEDDNIVMENKEMIQFYNKLNILQLRLEHFKRFYKTKPAFIEEIVSEKLAECFERMEKILRSALRDMELSCNSNGFRSIPEKSTLSTLIRKLDKENSLEELVNFFKESESMYATFENLLNSSVKLSDKSPV